MKLNKQMIKATLAVTLLSISLSSQAMTVFDLFSQFLGIDPSQVQTTQQGDVSVYSFQEDSNDSLTVFGSYDSGSGQGSFNVDLSGN